MGERASELPPSSLLSVDDLIKLRMQRVFIGALCRQMSSCNQSERNAIFGRDSCERKLSNHHDQGRRQGATAIIEFISITHTSKNFEGARGRLCSSKGEAPVPWHNGTMASPSLDLPSVLWHCWSVDRKDIRPVKKVRYCLVGGDNLTGALHVL